MPLQLLPMEASDMEAYYGIANSAFKDDIMALIYPKGFTQAAKDHSIAMALRDWHLEPESIKYLKATDSSLPDTDPYGKIVAISRWKFYYQDRTEAELEAEKNEGSDDPPAPDSDEAFTEEFFGNISRCKAEVMGGRAYVFLHLLATRPGYHRRGIGAMHLKWGLEQADGLGLPVYLESSPKGKALYARWGFEEVMPLPLDAKKWGLDHDLPHSIMLRSPRASH